MYSASIVFAENVWADVCCIGLHQLCGPGISIVDLHQQHSNCCCTRLTVLPLLAMTCERSLTIAAQVSYVHRQGAHVLSALSGIFYG